MAKVEKPGLGDVTVDEIRSTVIVDGAVEISDPTTGASAKLDATTSAIIAIGNEHHEQHDGEHFFAKQVVPFNGVANEEGFFMFRTPDTTKRIHARAEFYGDVEFTIEIYEGSTVTADGTAVGRWNNDRDSATTATLEAFANPTVNDIGTLIWIARFGSGKDATGVSPVFGYEIIVKRNTMYVFKATKIAVQVGYLDAGFWWYEHTPDN
jgi:hypothetical protein